MSRKKKTNTIAPALAEAALLEEAADTKLRAAEKMGRANALLNDPEDEVQVEPAPRFSEADLEPMPEGESQLSNFERAVADLNGQGRFEVFKLSMSGKRVKIGTWALSEYPEQMDRIAEQQGGGTFRIYLRNDRGEYIVSTTEEYDKTAYAPDPRTLAAAPATDGSVLDRVLERMDRASSEHRREMEAARLENQKMMLMMFDKMSQPRQETNLLDAIKLVKELSGDARSPMDSFREVLELAQSVKEETGLAEPEHPMVAAIDKVMKVASPLLTAWASKLAAPSATSPKTASVKTVPASTGTPPAQVVSAPAQIAAPVISPAVVALNEEIQNAPVIVPAVAPPAPAPAEAALASDPRVSQYAAALLMQASSGADPVNIGDAIINMTPDDALDELYGMVAAPEFIPLLLAAEPKLEAHKPWLESVSKHIVESLDAGDEEESETSTPVAEVAA